MLSFNISGSYTDLYEITMSQASFLQGRKDTPVSFDYFFRKVPNGGGYVLFSGLETLMEVLEDFRFTEEDLLFLKEMDFHPPFLEYLRSFRFRGSVWSSREGEIIFPDCPILRVEGNQVEAQLVETVLLNILNFESLIATKASRMKYVAAGRALSDFGLRRAQGPGGILASRAAVIGGFGSTSNVYAAQRFGLTATGTMAHAFIQSYDTELDAFRAFAAALPDHCLFLVDTYDTLESGLPNAITVAREMEQQGHRAIGIRLDSGDLAYLAKRARAMLDDAGLPYMKIAASNQLDEFVIRSLLQQQAPVDIFGVGSRLVTAPPDAALDGVYKLAMAAGMPRLKLSESLQKTTLPGIKQVLRTIDSGGMFLGADAVILSEEGEKVNTIYHPFESFKSFNITDVQKEPLLHKIMENGKRLAPPAPVQEIAAYAAKRLSLLPDEYKRFENPHVYKTGISKKLLELRDALIRPYKHLKEGRFDTGADHIRDQQDVF